MDIQNNEINLEENQNINSDNSQNKMVNNPLSFTFKDGNNINVNNLKNTSMFNNDMQMNNQSNYNNDINNNIIFEENDNSNSNIKTENNDYPSFSEL